MIKINIDTYLANEWNKISHHKISKQHTWELCRYLEKLGLLSSNMSDASQYSIGPFKIASTLNREDFNFVDFFLSTIIPAIIATTSDITFEKAYKLMLLPAIILFKKLLAGSFLIDNYIEWDILSYIIFNNKQEVYPNISDIINDKRFADVSEEKIGIAVEALLNKNPIAGKHKPLIIRMENGGFKSLV